MLHYVTAHHRLARQQRLASAIVQAAMKAGEQTNSRVPLHSRVHGLASKGQGCARRLCRRALCGCRRSSEP